MTRVCAVLQARLVSAQERAYAEVTIPAGLGLDSGHYKWRQNQSHVEAYVRLPGAGAAAAKKASGAPLQCGGQACLWSSLAAP